MDSLKFSDRLIKSIKKDFKTDKFLKNSKKLLTKPIKDTFSKKILLNDISSKYSSTKTIKDIFKKKSSNKLINSLINSNSSPNIKNFNNKLNSFNQSGLLSKNITRTESVDELVATIPEEVQGKVDISKLSMHSKRVLLRVASKLNTRLFDSHFEHFPILPKNKQEYCALMQKLAKAVSIETLPVSEKAIHEYYSAMQRLETLLPSVDISSLNVQLQMPRKVFVERAKATIDHLPEQEQRIVFDYFGFEIKDGKMSGYPVNNTEKPLEDETNHLTRQVIENLRGLVDKFTQDNRIILPAEKKPLEDALNNITKVFPEFLTTIGKQQHGTHKYTLDLHLLKVLQESMKNPEYQKLTVNEKKMFNMAILLHDISKTESIIDRAHPFESALDMSCIVQKMNLPIEQQERIVNMVKNHHWLEQISNVTVSDDEALKSIAFSFRKPNDFIMAKIFAESDLKGVSDSFFEALKGVLHSEQLQKVEQYLSNMYKTGIYFPQTHIPKASEIRLNPIKIGNREQLTENVVVELTKHNNLKALGFDNSQLETFVHTFNDYETGITTLRELAKETNEGVLSTSFIDRNNYATYYSKGIGVLLETEPTNIIQAGKTNLGSGTKKDLKNQLLEIFDSSLQTNYVGAERKNPRTEFSSKLKAELHLNDEEYAEFYQQLTFAQNLDSISNKRVKSAIEKVANSYLQKDMHNEVTVLAPKIRGIFVKHTQAEEIPYSIRKFAQDNDLPIIVFGN